jgi:hypothetical protein
MISPGTSRTVSNGARASAASEDSCATWSKIGRSPPGLSACALFFSSAVAGRRRPTAASQPCGASYMSLPRASTSNVLQVAGFGRLAAHRRL